MKKDTKIMCLPKDGPYLVSGGLPIGKQIIGIGKEGEPERWIQGKNVPSNQPCLLCRCGESNNKPFCDGTHTKIDFNGTETAVKKPHDKQAQVIDGPTLRLKDASALCAGGIDFATRGGGNLGINTSV